MGREVIQLHRKFEATRGASLASLQEVRRGMEKQIDVFCSRPRTQRNQAYRKLIQ